MGSRLSASFRPVSTVPRRTAKFLVRSVSAAIFKAIGAHAPPEFVQATCVVLAPHPDDETLGCGATIARKRAAGTQVTVVIVSDGGRSPHAPGLTGAEFIDVRRAEARDALSRLGVDAGDVEFLDFEDGTLSERLPDVVAALQRVMLSRSPQQVLVTSIMDRHPDHAAMGHVARLLLDSGDINGDLYEYPVWQRIPAVSTTVGAFRSLVHRSNRRGRPGRRTQAAQPRPLLVRTDGHLETKRLALAAYPSQLPYLPLGFLEDFLQPFEVFVAVPRR